MHTSIHSYSHTHINLYIYTSIHIPLSLSHHVEDMPKYFNMLRSKYEFEGARIRSMGEAYLQNGIGIVILLSRGRLLGARAQ